ncbi:MAG: cobalamin biosynthesis protein [Chloroflexota bacterium]
MTELWMLVTALAIDLLLGEIPASVHPVVLAGRLIAWLERAPVRGKMAQLIYGAVMVAVGQLVFVVPAWLVLNYARQVSEPAYFALGALLLKSTFSVRGLLRAAEAVWEPLAAGRLVDARAALRSLVSRDTTTLSGSLIAAAAVESVAENSSDSFVAPMFYFAIFGVPGALTYRVLNTYDSMIGYHGAYEYLGKVAARLDDLANLIPARLTGLLLLLSCPLRRASAAGAWEAMRKYHGATESPNAGWPMSAMAGALGVRLEKVGHYRLGDGRGALTADTIAQANRLATSTMMLAAILAAVVLAVRYVYFA